MIICMIDTYIFAGKVIRIDSVYPYIHRMCSDYRLDSARASCHMPDNEYRTIMSDVNWLTPHKEIPLKAEIEIKISPDDILAERARYEHGVEFIKARDKSSTDGIVSVFPDTPDSPPSDPYIETLAVYRRIAEKMPFYDTVLFHGSALAVDGEAYLFTAKSGTGKSTHARLWRELLKDKVIMINDDKPLIKIGKNDSYIYGTPWDGKHHLSTNTSAKLKAICILERGRENSIKEISKADALPMLLQQMYRPSEPAAMVRSMTLIDRLNVKFYKLQCNLDISAAELSYEAMHITN